MIKKSFFFFALLIFSLCSFGQCLWQVYPDKVVKWNYYDGDEFNKGGMDHSKWGPSLPWSRSVLTQDIFYTPNNLQYKKGFLRFVIEKKDTLIALTPGELDSTTIKKNKVTIVDGNKYPFKFTGGLIWSNRKYKYGYFEVKFKAPPGKGIWPAFWLYGANPNNEVDFFELKGEKEKSIHVDIHCPDGCANYKEGWFGYRKGWGHWVDVNKQLKDGFNIFSGEWTQDYIKFYLNGVLVAYTDHDFNLDMWLSIGTGVAKDGGPFKPGPDSKTPFPNFFDVDYTRVYRSDTLVNIPELKKILAGSVDSVPVYPDDFRAKNQREKLISNRDKKIKPGGVITLSVMQISRNVFSVRVLGMQAKDSVSATISGTRMRFSKTLQFRGNEEVYVTIPDEDLISFIANVNGQIINESIGVYYW